MTQRSTDKLNQYQADLVNMLATPRPAGLADVEVAAYVKCEAHLRWLCDREAALCAATTATEALPMTKQVGDQITTTGYHWSTIERTTEKAVLLRAQDGGATAWFPRSAFQVALTSKFDGKPMTYKLARWFRPTSQQERALGVLA